MGRSCGPPGTEPTDRPSPSIPVWRSDPLIARNVVSGNSANVEGGGLRFCFFGGALPVPAVTANVVVDNSAGSYGAALSCRDAEIVCEDLTIHGNSCAGASGGAVTAVSGSLTLRSSIVTGNPGGGVCRVGGDLVTEYCDVWANQGGDYINCPPGSNDLSCDPEFCDVSGGDYHLYETSCCQGTGPGGTDIGALGVACFTVPDVVFFDNFSDQDDAGWVVSSEGGGAFVVETGTYLGDVAAGGGSARSIVDAGAPFVDFACRIDGRLDGAPQPGDAWEIYLRWVDATRYYCVRMEGTAGGLYERTGVTFELLQAFVAPLPIDAWEGFLFTAFGDELTGATLDDGDLVPLFAHEDRDLPILAGTVGVGVASAAGSWRARFDDVMIATIESPPTAALTHDDFGLPPPPAPHDFVLRPNPFRESVAIEFELGQPRPVKLAVYAVDGRRVTTLVDDRAEEGRQRVLWRGSNGDGRPISPGTYFVRLQAGGETVTKKVVFLGD